MSINFKSKRNLQKLSCKLSQHFPWKPFSQMARKIVRDASRPKFINLSFLLLHFRARACCSNNCNVVRLIERAFFICTREVFNSNLLCTQCSQIETFDSYFYGNKFCFRERKWDEHNSFPWELKIPQSENYTTAHWRCCFICWMARFLNGKREEELWFASDDALNLKSCYRKCTPALLLFIKKSCYRRYALKCNNFTWQHHGLST